MEELSRPGSAPLEAGDSESHLISADTLAAWLDVSVRTLWRLRATGRLPQAIRLGGSIRWRSVEVRAWIAAGCPDRAVWELHRDGKKHHRSR